MWHSSQQGCKCCNKYKKRGHANFDKFVERLKRLEIEYIHSIKEHEWGQPVVRFYDLDKHIIEVAENLKIVCKRFLDSGMMSEQVSDRMGVSIKFIKGCMCQSNI